MGRPNQNALRLVEALNAWNAADGKVERAAVAFLKNLLDVNGSRGVGTHNALERLKHHVGFDRYATPAAVLEALASKNAAAVLEAARRAGL
jgi:hypothetical protein